MTKNYYHLKRLLIVSLFVLLTGSAYSTPYYVVNNNPWQQNFNDSAMDHVYGPGYWTLANYNTPAATIFAPTTPFVMLEGSDANAAALDTFLMVNQAIIENWVSFGGKLFINAAPNVGDTIECGFGGTLLRYPNYFSTGTAVDPNDTIFQGPFTPVATSYSGNYMGHAFVSGTNLDSLMYGANPADLVLARKNWGAGTVYFGGLTQPNFWSPVLEGENLWYNIFHCASTPTAPTDTGVLDSFVVFASNNCTPLQLIVKTVNYYPGMTVETFFGDNTSTISAVGPALPTGGTVVINHPYTSSGTYTIKQVLYNGVTVVDSLEFSYAFEVCNSIQVSFYYDGNNNCVQDAGEFLVGQPSLTEVDSNNVPIDTISALGGFYYIEHGSLGDIFTFKPISINGYYVTCPVLPQLNDTLDIGNNAPLKFGVDCLTGSSFDLAITAGINSCTLHASTGSVASNGYCAPQNATVTMTFSPKYTFNSSIPVPTSVVGQTITWNFASLSSYYSPYIAVNLDAAGPPLVAGDTVHYTYTITPTAGDTDATNNTLVIVDTVLAAFDPNHISVSPQGYIMAGTQLTYDIEFENVGNAPAKNVYVLDSLPDQVDVNSLRMVSASNEMMISMLHNGPHNVVKFEFPNINLKDSVHFPHDCTGMFTYTIKTKTGLPFGTTIDNRAGIYFDNNAVVMTNTVRNIIGFPTQVNGIGSDKAVQIYPNPASTELTIKTANNTYTSFTISNNIGQVMLQQDITNAQTKVNVKNLPAGMYFINLVGANGNEVRRFMKM